MSWRHLKCMGNERTLLMRILGELAGATRLVLREVQGVRRERRREGEIDGDSDSDRPKPEHDQA